MISGNIAGVRASVLERLEQLFDVETEKQQFADRQIVEEIASITTLLNREISVAIDRRGKVVEVAIGDSQTVKLPSVEKDKRGLSGIRIVHTHPNGSSRLSDVDISALLSLKLDAMFAIGVCDGEVNSVTLGFCNLVHDTVVYQMTDEWPLEDALAYDVFAHIQEAEKNFRMKNATHEVDDEKDVALVVGTDTESSLVELIELARACDIEVVEQIFQKRNSVDTKYFIGSGKVAEISLERQVMQANMVIFDDELTGVQLRNLEGQLGCRVIDRTMLILEIFARRAKTREAKIQVLIAKLKYERSRLSGQGVEMSRLGGGLGAKGSGETKLELDRRKIRDVIHHYEHELKKIESVQGIQKRKRNKSNIPQVALVGYTNVGKSTLRNLIIDLYSDDKAIKKEHVLSQNMLFATLSTTVRTFLLPDKRVASLVDTVGFIRKLPHDLVESFKSTLSEVIDADLIVHVIDSSSDEALEQIVAVNEVLHELHCQDKRQLIVFNKCDIATKEQLERLSELGFVDVVQMSAKSKLGIEQFVQTVSELLPNPLVSMRICIPYAHSEMLSQVYRDCEVNDVTYDEVGTVFTMSVSEVHKDKYAGYELGNKL
ncbi:MAG: GTPase HflX [Culicoidibacterales bacterium]